MTRFSRRACLTGMAALVTSCRGSDATAVQAGGRARPNLYQCEGCDGVFETDLAKLDPHARIGPVSEAGKPMRITGTVFHADGRTPARGVTIYAYQTNAQGRYANGTNETEWSRRHGRLRGWVKTGIDGIYEFETIKPAPYPNDTLPAHIHLTVLETGRRPYWIDDVVFDGEFGVTPAYRKKMVNQGGNGIVQIVVSADGTAIAHRDIVLERHP